MTTRFLCSLYPIFRLMLSHSHIQFNFRVKTQIMDSHRFPNQCHQHLLKCVILGQSAYHHVSCHMIYIIAGTKELSIVICSAIFWQLRRSQLLSRCRLPGKIKEVGRSRRFRPQTKDWIKSDGVLKVVTGLFIVGTFQKIIDTKQMSL